MRITIGGIPGAGKTTVAKILAKKFNLKYYYMGGIIRKMAEERGMDLLEFYKLGNDSDFIDKMIDDYQKKLGEREDNFIIEGRTSFYFIPNSFKIYLKVSFEEAAKRIYNDKSKRNEKKYSSVQETLESIRERIETEKLHYKKYYGFDCHDTKHYDFVLDTTNLNINDVVSILSKKIEEHFKKG